jgi:hypothetical protein
VSERRDEPILQLLVGAEPGFQKPESLQEQQPGHEKGPEDKKVIKVILRKESLTNECTDIVNACSVRGAPLTHRPSLL